jgi:hypothetical protein
MTIIDGIDPTVPPSGSGCLDCLAATPPGWWFHLRRSAQCGHVGCCDSSPSQHAQAHYRLTRHRLIQTFEPGEDWFWDFQAEDYYTDQISRPPQSPGRATSPGTRWGGFPTTGLSASTGRAVPAS